MFLINGVCLSKLAGSLNRKDVNCVCDPIKRMNATYCWRLISIGSWRSTENVVCNEKYRCLPYNDKLRKMKFFEGPLFCITAHRGWKTKRSKHREVSCNYWKGRSLNVVGAKLPRIAHNINIIILNTNVHCQKDLTFYNTNNCVFSAPSKVRKVKISLTIELIKFEDTIEFKAKNIA